ncbi:MAG: NADH-quinone oxidoreductase subunit NuoE [Halarsenatibacteraceae bacterium]
MCSDSFKELEPIIEKYQSKRGSLIPILHEIQKKVGYLPEDIQKYVAEKLNLPLSKISGVISFYSFFSTEPQGDHILGVCLGTACYVKGAEELVAKIKKELNVEEGGTSSDGKFTLSVTRCVGTCSLAPVLMVDDKVYGNLKEDDIPKILSEYQQTGQEGA